jgi:hypothetical protein
VDNAELPEYSQKPKRWAYDAVVYYELERLWQRPFYVIKESLGGTAIDPRCESSSNMHWSAGLLGKRMYEKVKDVLSVTYSNDRTPIMGWSSWNTYRVNISDKPSTALTCPTMWMPDIDKIELRKR